jgi:hypothetical protein
LAALRTALWNYDRTLPLMEGAVKVEGHRLAIEVDRPEAIFAKAFPNAAYVPTTSPRRIQYLRDDASSRGDQMNLHLTEFQ